MQHDRRHQKGLASVGSASSLFGGGDEEPDFFSSATVSSTTTQAPHSSQYQHRQSPIAYSSSNQGISTVLEEEEPESPQLGRRRRKSSASTNLFHDDGQQDWRGSAVADQQNQQSYQQPEEEYVEPPFYPGFIYVRETNTYEVDPDAQQDWGQGDQNWSQNEVDQQAQASTYQNEGDVSANQYDEQGQQDWLGGAGATEHSQDQYQQPSEEYTEPPYYPGFVYDPVSNSYLVDPNAQQEQWGQDEQNWDQSGYDSQEQLSGGQYNEGDAPTNVEAYQTNEAQHQNYDSYLAPAQEYQSYAHPADPEPAVEPEPASFPPPPSQPLSPIIPAVQQLPVEPPPRTAAAAAPPRATSAQAVAPPPRAIKAATVAPTSTQESVAPPPRSGSGSAALPRATQAPASVAPPPRASTFASPSSTTSAFVPPPPTENAYSISSRYTSPPPLNDPAGFQHHQRYDSLAADDDFDESGWDEAITTSPDPSHDDDAARRAAMDLDSPVSPRFAPRQQWAPQQPPVSNAQTYGLESLTLDAHIPPLPPAQAPPPPRSQTYHAPPPPRALSGTTPPPPRAAQQAQQSSPLPEVNVDTARDEAMDKASTSDQSLDALWAPEGEEGALADDDAWFGGGDEESPPSQTPVSRSPPPQVQVIPPQEETDEAPEAHQPLEKAETVAPVPQVADPTSPVPDPIKLPGEAPTQQEALRVATTSPTVESADYGFDDSQVFGNGGMSASTSGSNYGEWTGESEVGQGYDYVSGYEVIDRNEPMLTDEAGNAEPADGNAYDASNAVPYQPHSVLAAMDQSLDSYSQPTVENSESLFATASQLEPSPYTPYSPTPYSPTPTQSPYDPSSTAASYGSSAADSPFGARSANNSPYPPPPASGDATYGSHENASYDESGHAYAGQSQDQSQDQSTNGETIDKSQYAVDTQSNYEGSYGSELPEQSYDDPHAADNHSDGVRRSHENPDFSQYSASSTANSHYAVQPATNDSPYGAHSANNNTSYASYQSNDSPYASPRLDAPTTSTSYAPPRAASPYEFAPAPRQDAASPYGAPPRRATNDSPYGAPPPTRVFTPDQSRPQFETASPQQPPGVYGSPPKRSIAAYGSSPKKTVAAQYASRPPPRQLDTSSRPYASYQPPPSAPLQSEHHDSYASFPTHSQAQANDPYSTAADGNMTAPASYGTYKSQPTYMAPPSLASGGRRHSYDEQPDAYRGGPAGPYSRQGSTTSLNSLGTAQDLGLERCGAPVVSFGFGGRILLIFPNEARPAYGMDSSPYGAAPGAPDAPSTPSTVHIRKTGDLYATRVSTTFPGPIFMDGGKANAGKKRKEAVTWLDQRIEELQQEISFVHATPPSGYGSALSAYPSDKDEKARKLETRMILIKLVKALVENEGKLGGTPKIDEAIRAILVPFSSAVPDVPDTDLPLASELAFTAPMAIPATGVDAPFTTYTVTSSNLDKITEFLLRGERRRAVKYALDHKLWAHAFVISSCVDTDCWKDVVAEFLRSELAPPVGGADPTSNGREGLRVAYSMFAGLGAESVLQFLPPRPLAPPPLLPSQHLAVGAGLIPRAPTPVSAQPTMDNLSESVLSKWQETVALIIANRSSGDSAALTALGDTLKANGWLDAAHVCYLLSPSTSPINGVGTGAKFSLVGGEVPTPFTADGLDLESIMLTELVEFAFSLTPAIKGQDPFVGFPHLQALKLQYASELADAGLVSQAQKYTDAIGGTLKLATKPSPYYNAGFVAQVKALSDRLVAAPGQDKTGSWIARKVPRPTVESLWTGLEGRFTKFVAGEGETSAQQLAAKAEVVKQQTLNGGPIGPFSHYSSISPASTSGTLSRNQSQTDLVPVFHPPSRTTSPAALAPPGPPPVKRAPFKTHHSRSSSLGFAGYNYDPSAPPPWQSYTPVTRQEAPVAPPTMTYNDEQYPAEQTASAYEPEGAADYDPEGATPNGRDNPSWYSEQPSETNAPDGSQQAPAFLSAGDSFAEDDSGFISPMGAYTPSASPAPTSHYPKTQHQPQSHRRTTTREEMEELGLGNSKSRKPGFDAIDEQAGEGEEGGAVTPTERTESQPQPQATEKPGIKPSKSWLGGWFKREPSPAPGAAPIKANLGEGSSFVYDPQLKKWVNKKGGDTGAPLATAPPPRAATASPTRASGIRPAAARFMSETPPPMPQNAASFGRDMPAPALNRARTSADLNDLHRSGQFRSASAQAGFPPTRGPPPPTSRPPSAGPPP
ncbi:COPII coat assembly protein SEC16, partial [Phenoliferia sp. Uapishka_3]